MAPGLPPNMTEEERKALGAQLSVAAYAESPIVPEGLALTVIIIAGVTIGLATIVVALRTFVRFPLPGRSSKGWGWDDTFALLSYVSNLPPYTILSSSQRLEPHTVSLLMVMCIHRALFCPAASLLSKPHTTG